MQSERKVASRPLRRLPCVAALALLLASGMAWAGDPASMLGEVVKQDYSPALKNFVILTMLSIVPVLLVGMTSFTRIVIVLSLLRHGLGLPQTPPNSVVITLALCLTYFSMAPVIDSVSQQALTPYLENKISAKEALERGKLPVRSFMVRQTRESDLAAVLSMSRQPAPKRNEDIPFSTLMPAFLLSELKTAFQIGFVIFLPFLVIDLVVAAILMGLGMIMVPPATLSLPLKLLLFILIDGWVLVSRALLSSFWN